MAGLQVRNLMLLFDKTPKSSNIAALWKKLTLGQWFLALINVGNNTSLFFNIEFQSYGMHLYLIESFV